MTPGDDRDEQIRKLEMLLAEFKASKANDAMKAEAGKEADSNKMGTEGTVAPAQPEEGGTTAGSTSAGKALVAGADNDSQNA